MTIYYTPTIEEFHIGFEYEHLGNKGFYKKIIEPFDLTRIICENTNLKMALEVCIEYNQVRVKLLDREDIESLGWKHIGSLWFEKGTFKLRKWRENNVLIKKSHPGEEDETLFSGDILNKSELKFLMERLGIK